MEKVKTVEKNLLLHAEEQQKHGRENKSIVDLLQDIQDKYNYLPEEVLRNLAAEKNLSLIDIYSVATFYKSFSLVPRGNHKIVCCSGTACHVRGCKKVTEEISRILDVKPGGITEDGEYSLETVNCLGACALAPLVVFDGEYCGKMTPSQVELFLEEHLSALKKKKDID